MRPQVNVNILGPQTMALTTCINGFDETYDMHIPSKGGGVGMSLVFAIRPFWNSLWQPFLSQPA